MTVEPCSGDTWRWADEDRRANGQVICMSAGTRIPDTFCDSCRHLANARPPPPPAVHGWPGGITAHCMLDWLVVLISRTCASRCDTKQSRIHLPCMQLADWAWFVCIVVCHWMRSADVTMSWLVAYLSCILYHWITWHLCCPSEFEVTFLSCNSSCRNFSE